MKWTIVYESEAGLTIREGNSTMEYYRILNQLKFREIEYIADPPKL